MNSPGGALIPLLVLAAPVSAQLRAVQERSAGGPALWGDRVFVGDAIDGVRTVSSAPVAGRKGTAFGTLQACGRPRRSFAAGSSDTSRMAAR